MEAALDPAQIQATNGHPSEVIKENMDVAPQECFSLPKHCPVGATGNILMMVKVWNRKLL